MALAQNDFNSSDKQ